MTKPLTLSSLRDHRTLVVRVSPLLKPRVRLGLLFVRFGAWIATVGYREEREE